MEVVMMASEAYQWAHQHFGSLDLGDQSLPVQHQSWAELKAAYRFSDNPHITPDALQAQHRRMTFESCSRHRWFSACRMVPTWKPAASLEASG
jgi:hypothetical protein